MGGNIASLYAGSMPERVSAVVNVEGFGLPDSDPEDAPQRYRGWLEARRDAGKFSRYPDFASLASEDTHCATLACSRPRRASLRGNGQAKRAPMSGCAPIPNTSCPTRCCIGALRAEACWRSVRAPVLLVSGANSPFARQFGDHRDIAVSVSETVEVGGVGHMVHFEAPEWLAEQIEKFLKKTL